MSDLVGNPEDRFSHNGAQMLVHRKLYKLRMNSKGKATSIMYIIFLISKLEEEPMWKSRSFQKLPIAYQNNEMVIDFHA